MDNSIKVILQNEELSFINGTTSIYFAVENIARQGDTVSAHLFILVLEIAFLFIKDKKGSKGLKTFSHTFPYTVFVNDATFFLKDKLFVTEVMNIFKDFSIL